MTHNALIYVFNLFIINMISHSIGSIPLYGTTSLCGSVPTTDVREMNSENKDQGIQPLETDDAIVDCHPATKDAVANLKPSGRSFIVDISKCAENNQNYCTKNDDYPTEYVNYLVKKHWNALKYAFSSDTVLSDNDGFGVKLNRIVRSIHGNELCSSHKQIIYPTSGKRLDGTELYILNTPEHKQGVSVSLCDHSGKSCRLADNFPDHFRTECKQHYVYRELLALSPDGTSIKEKIQIPAHCTCATSPNGFRLS